MALERDRKMNWVLRYEGWRMRRTLTSAGAALQDARGRALWHEAAYLHDPDGYSLCFQWPAK